MPFGQVSIDEGIQWAILGEQFGTHRFDLFASRLQRLFNQFVLGLEVRVKAAVGEPWRGSASIALNVINKLYGIERDIKEVDDEHRHESRQQNSLSVLFRLHTWLEKTQPQVMA